MWRLTNNFQTSKLCLIFFYVLPSDFAVYLGNVPICDKTICENFVLYVSDTGQNFGQYVSLTYIQQPIGETQNSLFRITGGRYARNHYIYIYIYIYACVCVCVCVL